MLIIEKSIKQDYWGSINFPNGFEVSLGSVVGSTRQLWEENIEVD
jgi:hypothetical protein